MTKESRIFTENILTELDKGKKLKGIKLALLVIIFIKFIFFMGT